MVDEIHELRKLLALHRKNIQILLEKVAVFGTHTPNYMLFELQDHRKHLADLKQQLVALGHVVDDQSGDTGNPTDIFRTTQEQALARLATMPTDSLPEPRHEFAPGSRWYNRARNPDFVGREPELRQLTTTLKAGTTTIISGPTAIATGVGGIGKTDLATEFMYRYGRFFAGGVFWLSFANPEQVDAEIAACGGPDALDLFSARDKLELDDQVKMVLKVWSQPMPRLLICDNCEDQALLRTYRKKIGAACRMLVTSRDHTWKQPAFTRVALNTLQRSESIQLLQRLKLTLSDDEADMIAETLGDFPLALHLAGSYLATYDHTVDVYLEKLTELDMLNHPSMQGRGAEFSPTEHDLHVARTFALSFDRLDNNDPIDMLAIHLLACAAHLAPGESIPRAFLLAMVPEGTNQDDAVDGLKRARAIGLLDGDDMLIMHRLVHQYIRGSTHPHQTKAQEKAQEQVHTGIMIMIEKALDQGSVLPMLALEHHLRYLATHAYSGETPQDAQLLDHLAHFFDLQGRYAEAEHIFLRVLSILEYTYGHHHVRTTRSMNSLATVYYKQGRYQKAETLYRHIWNIRQHHLDLHDPDIAGSMNNLARIYEEQGHYQKAMVLFKRAFVHWEQHLGSQHHFTAGSLSNLARVYRKQGEYTKAEQLLLRAINVLEHALGANHPQTALTYTDLARVYTHQQRYTESESLLLRATEIVEHTLGRDHLDSMSTLASLAAVYEEQQRYTEAESLYLRVLDIREQNLDVHHPDIAATLHDLAIVYACQGDYDKAESLLCRVITIGEQILGSQHPDMAIILYTLARVYTLQANYSQAWVLICQAWQIYQQASLFHHDSIHAVRQLYETLNLRVNHYVMVIWNKKEDDEGTADQTPRSPHNSSA